MFHRLKKLCGRGYDWLDRTAKFSWVLSPGATAVQVGVDSGKSSLWQMAKIVGPQGTVIGIEADPENFRKVQEQAKNVDCRVLLVNKGVYNRRATMDLRIGKIIGDNELTELREAAPAELFKGPVIPIEVDTVDNILADLGIAYASVSHINLTINGAEYEALKAMPRLLTESENLSVNAIAGRQYEKQSRGLDTFEGKPDYQAICELLKQYGFRTQFKRANAQIWEGWVNWYLRNGLLQGNWELLRTPPPGAVLAKKGSKEFGWFESYAFG